MNAHISDLEKRTPVSLELFIKPDIMIGWFVRMVFYVQVTYIKTSPAIGEVAEIETFAVC